MNIVCGDALGISCGTWVAIWNGAIGAFVAAVIGGVVALVVVRLTNAQQRRSSERSVEIAAIADFVAVVEEAQDLARKGGPVEDFDRNKYRRLMSTAVLKLGMSGSAAEPVHRLIQFWPYDLTDLMRCLFKAVHHKEPYAEDVFLLLNSAVALISARLPRIAGRPLTDEDRRLLIDMDDRLQEAVKLIEGPWAGSDSQSRSRPPVFPPESTSTKKASEDAPADAAADQAPH